MKKHAGSFFIAIAMLGLFAFTIRSKKPSEKNSIAKEYVCTPCGLACDAAKHTGPGLCKECNMPLVEKSTITFKQIEPQELCMFISSAGKDNVVLLDVRTPAEFNGKAADKFGRLKNA